MIKKIIKHFGGLRATARALHVAHPSVVIWQRNGIVPPRRAIEIEIITKGKFRAIDIYRSNRGDESSVK